jgi:chorismate mutase / prephenate dehydratase
MSQDPPSLEELRRRIDRLDDALHDALMHRAELVAQVARVKQAGATPPLRPGREAQILRRLLARHRGGFPRAVLVRLWRELLSGTTAMQAELHVAVFAQHQASAFWDLARDHFGSQTGMSALRSTGEVVGAVIDGRADLGVLPVPGQRDGDTWWRLLMAGDTGKPRVIARLPFGARGNARGEGEDALVIARTEAEASGADRSLYIVETAPGLSRTRVAAALADAGLGATRLAGTEPGGASDMQVVELGDWIPPNDARLKSAAAALGDKLLGLSLLGCYAVPLDKAQLAEGQS